MGIFKRILESGMKITEQFLEDKAAILKFMESSKIRRVLSDFGYEDISVEESPDSIRVRAIVVPSSANTASSRSLQRREIRIATGTQKKIYINGVELR